MQQAPPSASLHHFLNAETCNKITKLLIYTKEVYEGLLFIIFLTIFLTVNVGQLECAFYCRADSQSLISWSSIILARMNATWGSSNEHQLLVEFLNRSPATIAVETSIILLIGLIAIGGNLLVVISIFRNPSLRRTITNYFVLSLAMSDIMYPFTNLPFMLAWSIKSTFTFKEGLWCQIQAIVSFSLIHVSILTMALMAVNRFVRVCKTHKYNKWFNKKSSLVMLGTVWVASYTYMTVNLTEKTLFYVRFEPQKIICGLSRSNKDFFSTVLMTLCLAFGLGFPFTVMGVCYYKIFKKIREHKRNIAPFSSDSNGSSLGMSVQEIKVTWTTFAVLIGYLLTWLPMLLIVVASYFKDLPREVHMIVTYSMASSSAINPVIYGVLNPAFRKEYKKIIKWQ
ncbi:melatonin receptor type 1A-like [Actinia tenebrosa]|uniref:Melatonin receptor type 1A-like n=1 Tax=Actinia tenebrosa TaxID=6105 RepID=A0A6P8IAL9_ACTTE|nr:melatonin receptor type 1A-like [Actinia tenebrosa]